MSIEEKKVRAYDIMVQIQYLQNELSKVNQEIAQENQASQQPIVKEPKVAEK